MQRRRWRTTTWPTSSTSTIPSPPPRRHARPSTSSSARATGTCSGPVSPTSSSPSPRPPTGTRPPRATHDNPNRHLFADDEFFITVARLVRALRGDAEVADELLGKLNDDAGERGPPGHRHCGHRASVRRRWRATTMARRCARVASPSSRSSGPCPSPETTDGGRGRWPPGVPTSSAISPPRRSCSTSANSTRPGNSRRCSAPKRC